MPTYVQSLGFNGTSQSVSKSITPLELFNFKIPANTLGTNRLLVVNLTGDIRNSSVITNARKFTIDLKKNGTTIIKYTSIVTETVKGGLATWTGWLYLINLGSASTNLLYLAIHNMCTSEGPSCVSYTGTGASPSFNYDTTTDLSLSLYFNWVEADSGATYQILNHYSTYGEII